eukprot:gene1575-2109_t
MMWNTAATAASGLFVTGTSIANFMAVLIARTRALGPEVRDSGIAAGGAEGVEVARVVFVEVEASEPAGGPAGGDAVEVGAVVADAVEGVVDAVLGFIADVPSGDGGRGVGWDRRDQRVGRLRAERRELRDGERRQGGGHRREGADDLELAGGFAREVEGAVEVAGAELLEGELEEDAGFAEAGGRFEEDERVAFEGGDEVAARGLLAGAGGGEGGAKAEAAEARAGARAEFEKFGEALELGADEGIVGRSEREGLSKAGV